MKKILFLIHDLGPGGAEKVLIHLVNNMDTSQFNITVMALFDGGVNHVFLSPHIAYKACFSKMIRGNSHFMKLLTPGQLHKMLIKERYDVEITYLEGPAARIVSGCPDSNIKLVSWIHIEQKTARKASASFRSLAEAKACYARFDRIVCVSETVKEDFCGIFHPENPVEVLYNTVESEEIRAKAKEQAEDGLFSRDEIKLCGVGKLTPNKGFDRLARIHARLRAEGFPVHTYILGIGPEQKRLEDFIFREGLSDSVTLLGYRTNPYKYVAACDLFVCASHAEGFSTAATEALILGTPVVTTRVSGMGEMLGKNGEYGVITENDEDALYEGIRRLVSEPGLLSEYARRAALRGDSFNKENTVRAVEEMLLGL